MDVNQIDYQSTTHTSPRKNVFLLSCMDLRLLDNLVTFMNFENLDNRYDQFILAGAAAGAMQMPSWHKAFFDHLVLAVGLHQIKYVYIVEHRDCGAYMEFFDKSYVKYDPNAGHNIYDLKAEHKDHSHQAEIRCRRKSGVSLSFSGGNPVSVYHSGGNPVSVYHSCPKRRTDTGLREKMN